MPKSRAKPNLQNPKCLVSFGLCCQSSAIFWYPSRLPCAWRCVSPVQAHFLPHRNASLQGVLKEADVEKLGNKQNINLLMMGSPPTPCWARVAHTFPRAVVLPQHLPGCRGQRQGATHLWQRFGEGEHFVSRANNMRTFVTFIHTRRKTEGNRRWSGQQVSIRSLSWGLTTTVHQRGKIVTATCRKRSSA